MIPKIIHYCWLSNDPVPADLRKYVDQWKKKLPDYEFIKWDFSKFDINKIFWVKEAYEKKKYAFACDFIRLYAVYNYGGIYMDMDIEVIKSFDPLLNQKYMFAYEGKRGNGIEAGCFGAEKGDFFLKLCLEYYKDRHFIKTDGSFDEFPLPQIMQNIVKEHHIAYRFYTNDFFTAKSFNTGIITKTENTYCVHHFAGSWKNDMEKARIIELQRVSKKYGWLGRNYVEIKTVYEDWGIQGIWNLIIRKIRHKLL